MKFFWQFFVLPYEFVVDVATTNQGSIYHDDTQALETLHLVALALVKTLTVRVVGGGRRPLA